MNTEKTEDLKKLSYDQLLEKVEELQGRIKMQRSAFMYYQNKFREYEKKYEDLKKLLGLLSAL